MSRVNSRTIRGAGGDSGASQQAPQEAADTLQSSAAAQILDLICEGEIEGLVDGAKSIYLDGTPIQNDDGTYNFSNVVVYTRAGTQSQDYIPGLSSIENEINVNVEVKVGAPGPIVRTITNDNVDAVRVLISFPQLAHTNPDSGDLGGTSVQYAIDVQSDGGGFVEMLNQKIFGKSMSKYQRSHRIALSGSPPWDIRVRRITADSESVNTQNRTVWESYAEIEDVKLGYPNSALVGIRVKASQFSAIPSRAYEMKLLKIQVPTNYDPETRVYTGDWDGTFKIAWTDNPAWVFYDLMTSERYGLGNFLAESEVDKWSLYTIGKYCDESVDDGFGGTEPRFTCNLYIQSRQEAYKVINDLCSVFRGMAYWAAGTLTVTQDSPQDPSYLFTPANVIDGKFNYMGVSAKQRHTVALVTWNDPNDQYRQKVEYVEDQVAILKVGVIETQVTAMGCTSRGQAHRLGKWILYTERYQSETVSFQSGIEVATLRPGDVMKIADPIRAGARRGGRISAGTTTSVTIDDDAVQMENGLTISVVLPDFTVEERQVDSVSDRVVSWTSPMSQAPQKDAIWLVSTTDIEAQQFRVVSVSEGSDGLFEVTGVAHNSSKYDFIDFDNVLTQQDISNLSATPDSPTNLTVTETLYAVGKDVRTKITLSWQPVLTASSYIVQYRKDDLNVITIPETNSNEVEILNAEPGTYDFWVYALSALGKRSVPSTTSAVIKGKGAAPQSVENFSLIPQAGMAYLTWDQAEDLDVLIGGTVRIRYTPDLEDQIWKNSVDVIQALPGTATHASVPLMPGTYMAKFIDSSGIASDEESLIVTTIPAPLTLNVVETITESPAFPGLKTDCFVTEAFGGALTMIPSGTVDEIPMIDDVILWDFFGGVVSEATYDFENVLDLGESYSSRVTASLKVSAVDIAESIDERLDPIDTWVDLDGDFIDDVNAELYLATSDDGIIYTEWKKFFVGEYVARYFKFQLRMTSTNTAHNILVQGVSVTVDMPDRVENLAGLTSGASSYSVTFDFAFHETPALGITAYNMNSSDYYQISAQDRTGFTIVFKDSSDTVVSRNFDVIAKGYGRQAI